MSKAAHAAADGARHWLPLSISIVGRRFLPPGALHAETP